MRKVVVSEFVSLDGIMEGPGPDDPFKHAGWTMPFGHPDIGKFKLDELLASDALLLGRVTYQGFAAAWPSGKDEAGFADRMNGLPKYVVSTTLKELTWNNSTVFHRNIPEEVSKLKEQPGQDILVAGSSVLVHTLIGNDLIDEYRLLVYPVVLGSGKRLFKDLEKAVPLKLKSSKSFPTGADLLVYEPVRS